MLWSILWFDFPLGWLLNYVTEIWFPQNCITLETMVDYFILSHLGACNFQLKVKEICAYNNTWNTKYRNYVFNFEKKKRNALRTRNLQKYLVEYWSTYRGLKPILILKEITFTAYVNGLWDAKLKRIKNLTQDFKYNCLEMIFRHYIRVIV